MHVHGLLKGLGNKYRKLKCLIIFKIFTFIQRPVTDSLMPPHFSSSEQCHCKDCLNYMATGNPEFLHYLQMRMEYIPGDLLAPAQH